MAIVALLAVLAFLLVASAFEWLAMDVVALVSLGGLLVFRLVTAQEAIAGFANEAVITVLMVMILSDSLVQSGLVAKLGHRLAHVSGTSWRRAAALLLATAGGISGFINNTAAIAIFLPVALQLAKQYRFSPSKLLLPLNYAVVIGGTVTLIGTSTNILVSSLARQRGLPPIGMFELAPLGLIFTAIGLLYSLLLLRMLPDRGAGDGLTRKYQITSYLTELRVPKTSRLIGSTVVEEQLSERFALNVLEILRGTQKISIDLRNTRLQEDDVLLVRGSVTDLIAFKEQQGLLLLTDLKLSDADLSDENSILAEVQLSPVSMLEGKSLLEIDFRRRFGCFVLALNRTGEVIRDKLAAIRLKRWDTLLVFGSRPRVEALYEGEDFLPLQEVDVRLSLARRWWLHALIFPAVILVATLTSTSILEAAILGVVVLLATRALQVQRMYKAINWTVIFLLATTLPLGTAMESTGLAERVASWVGIQSAQHGPHFALALVYLITMVLTELLSNAGTAVLMVPIALSTAQVLQTSNRPFLIAVTFAASCGFMTPIGYQTNAMVFAPGNYRYLDFLRAGAPLNFVFWILATLLIPTFWPF